MKTLSRILETRFLATIACALGLIVISIPAFSGDRFSIGMLMFFAMVWLAFAFFNGSGWRRSNEGWHYALTEWHEQHQLTQDMTSLLTEALSDLSTYDRDKADDIQQRANTIILLRFQNFNERERP